MREYLLSKEEIVRYDNNTIEKQGMNQDVLIERAAVTVAMYVLEQFPNNNKQILVVAGNGNNGADGVATARILKEYGYDVELLIPIDADEYRPSLAAQVRIAQSYDIDISTELGNKEYDIIIDALFGVGLNRTIAGDYSGLIKKLNKKHGYKISVDIPSGIDCDTGEVLGSAFVADTTVTFGFYKRGQFLNEGPKHCGTLIKRNVGINEYCFYDTKPEMFMYHIDEDCSSKIDIGRNPQGNKGSFGKVLIIAGREDMSGACILAVKSALRSGCGMVAVLTEEANRNLMIAALPETIVHTYKDSSEIDAAFEEAEKWCDCIAIGPGIGTDDIGTKLLQCALDKSNKPMIIDADAINILSRNKRMKITLLDKQGNADTIRPIIFTPHIKEFARISQKTIEEILNNRTGICQFFSRQFHCILVLKDAYTYVCQNDNIYINTIANDALATAGSGDVLTGLMASFLSQYLKKDTLIENSDAKVGEFPYYAAVMSVFIHSMAGQKAAEMNGRSYMIASDVIEKYGEILV